MILVDIPRGPKSSTQYQNQAMLRTHIRAFGVECEAVPLDAGDAAFEGCGPDGTIAVGIERKGLHDMLSCIEDSRYAGDQRIKMKNQYTISKLFVEGMWRPREDGLLMESRDGCQWWPCKPHGKQVMYSKLRRYLISISYSGVIVNFTRNLQHTAFDICEEYHYHQKRWKEHKSLLEIKKMAIPQLNGKPPLVAKWANDIDEIGITFREEAVRLFRTPIRLANSSEEEWTQISRIGLVTAQKVVKQIRGVR